MKMFKNKKGIIGLIIYIIIIYLIIGVIFGLFGLKNDIKIRDKIFGCAMDATDDLKENLQGFNLFKRFVFRTIAYPLMLFIDGGSQFGLT